MAAGACENFAHRKVYQQGQYIDVTSDMWFYNNVKTAFEAGLMSGNSPNTFNPRGNITYAEAITIAARLHSIYTTNREFTYNGKPWYQGYVDYAIKNGLITGPYSDYSAPATRVEFAIILSHAFPEEEFTPINQVDSIPDLPTWYGYEDTLLLYRAGILTGNDSNGTFAPLSYIERSAVAAIVSRMVDKDLRIEFSPITNVPESDEKPEESVSTQKRTIEISPHEKDLYVEGELTLKADIFPDDGLESVQWYSSNQDVAKVENGIVTGLSVGRVTITAQYGSSTDQCELSVIEKPKPSEQLLNYLNEQIPNRIETPMGDYDIEIKVIQNTSSSFANDFEIRTLPRTGSFPWYSLTHSITHSEEEKEETLHIFQEFQKSIYEVASELFPDKKLCGGYYYSWYKYPYLQVGYESERALSWTNYNGDILFPDDNTGYKSGENYYLTNITQFHWSTRWDDYVFEE